MSELYIVALLMSLLGLLSLGKRSVRSALLAVLTLLSLVLGAAPWAFIDFRGAATGALFVTSLVAMLLGLANGRGKFFAKAISCNYMRSLFAFGMILIVFLAISDNKPYGQEKIQFFLIKSVLPLMGFAALGPYGKRDTRIVLSSIVIASCLTALNLLAYGDLSADRAVVEGQRNPITYAREICIGGVVIMILALAGFRKGLRKLRYVWSLICMLSGLGLFAIAALTGSRAPLGIALLTIVLLQLLPIANRLERTRNIVGLGLLGLMVFSAVAIVAPRIEYVGGMKRITDFVSETPSLESEARRMFLMRKAVEVALESGGIGVGTGGYAVEGRSYPHNLLAEVAAELGAVGLVVLGFVFFFSGQVVINAFVFGNATAQERSLVAAWVYMLGNVMISGDIAGNYMFWVTGGLGSILFLQSRERVGHYSAGGVRRWGKQDGRGRRRAGTRIGVSQR